MACDPLWNVIRTFADKEFPFGLTARKIRERARVVEAETDEHQVVFDMNRHRGILGERYVPGSRMRNYVTEWRRYTFDVRAETLEEIAREVIDAHVEVDGVADTIMESALSFHIEPADHGFHVEEHVAGKTITVTSKKDFIRWARGLPESWDLSHYAAEAREYLDDDGFEGFEDTLLAHCKNRAEREAEICWQRDVDPSYDHE